jgi:DNA polymerase elongation subunit (family B)
MDKHKVLGEIKGFLEGYNDDIKYLVNVETDPRTNFAECIIHEPNQPPRIEKIKYEPFVYMKDLSRFGRELYVGRDDEHIKSKQIKYGINIVKLKTGNQKRLLDGYCYKITSYRSYNDIINYVRDGGIDPYEKLTNENGDLVRDNEGKLIFKNRDFFNNVTTTEQFFISTQSRLYKGYEQYKNVHRMTFDIETNGLRYQIARMFAIGVRDNRGFERILEVDKRDDDESEIHLIQDFFNTIDYIRPAVILGHNSETFDFDFILGRANILKMDLSKVPNGLKEGIILKRKGNTSVKYGNTSDKYTATEMWGYSIIDTIHAAKRTAAVNSDLKKVNLKYIAKFEKFARENRTYIKGEDNDIGRYYNENKVFLINDKNNYLEIPNEHQEVARNLYTLQANREKLNTEQYNEFRKKYVSTDKKFIIWFKANCLEQNLTTFIGGRKLVKQYLLDDLWETEQVDELYNQSSFLLAKIVPTTYHRICTMGTAAVWNLLLTAWSYENDLAIPIPDKYEKFSGGLARTYKKGYSTRIIKIDYASLYPMIQLTEGVFPMFDITGVMEKMLLYMTTTRNIYKKMGAGNELDVEEVGLLKQVDPEIHNKYINNLLSSEDIAMFKIKQLPIKILNNSLYGALGSHISFNWSDNICASRITCVARLRLRQGIHWFTQYGCVALLAVTDGINFQIPDMTTIRVTDDNVLYDQQEGVVEEMWKYNGKTGIEALIDKFNFEEMPPPYMSVDNDGESLSCLNLARINYATLSEVKDKKTGDVKKKN